MENQEKTQENAEKYHHARVILDASLHTRPSASVVEISRNYFENHGCKIYVHKKGIEDIKFPDMCTMKHEGKLYLDTRSIIYMMALTAKPGEELEFIASVENEHAKRALAEITDLSKTFEESPPYLNQGDCE
jgi:phosphotransferase system HPr-like phosphotransfer protein